MEGGAGTGDFPSFAAIGIDRRLLLPSPAKECPRPPQKTGSTGTAEGIPPPRGRSSRPAPQRNLPGNNISILFYLMNSALSRVRFRCLPPKEPGDGSVGHGDPVAPVHRIGRTRREIHLFRRPSEGHGVVLPALAGEVGGHGEQPRSRKDLPGTVALIEGDPDREPAIGSEASGDRDQAQRHATPLQPLLGRQDLVGAPEDEDQDRIRCAGQFNSFVNPPIRIVPLERRTPPCVVPLMSTGGPRSRFLSRIPIIMIG